MSDIVVYGADWCPDCIRAKKFFNERNISYTYVDLVAKPEAKEIAKDISGRSNIPVVVYPDGSHLVEPTNAQLEEKTKSS